MASIPFFLLTTLILSSFSLTQSLETLKECAIPAMFVFGDSIVDSGNNNFIDGSTSYNDWTPYGIDFALGVSGRFTNNKTMTDALGEHLGVPILPVFNNKNITHGKMVIRGVNYASAGSGVLDDTNSAYGVMPLSHQISDFLNVTLPEIEALLDNSTDLSDYITRSIFVFNTASNDYAANCFEGVECDLPEFTAIVMGNFTKQLKRIYEKGARKFVLINNEPVGCSPFGRLVADDGGCETLYNYACSFFNSRLREDIDNITSGMPGSIVTYFDAYTVMMEIINDPSTYGISVLNASCCSCSSKSDYKSCIDDGDVCSDRSTYLYFDGVHPTDATNAVLSSRMFSSDNETLVYPYNVSRLACLSTEAISSISPSTVHQVDFH